MTKRNLSRRQWRRNLYWASAFATAWTILEPAGLAAQWLMAADGFTLSLLAGAVTGIGMGFIGPPYDD